MKTRIIITIFLIILLNSCATVTNKTRDEYNRQVYEIDCSGKMISMDVCYKKADQLCPAGYVVTANQARAPSENMLPFTIMALSTKLSESIPGVLKGITVRCN